MKKLIAVLAILAFSQPALAARSISAQVNGLVCAFCAAAIEKRLKSFAEVKEVYVNLGSKVVAVELHAGKALDPTRVAAEIKEAGYDVVTIGPSDKSVAEIRAATKK
jgi:cation transport ATPase